MIPVAARRKPARDKSEEGRHGIRRHKVYLRKHTSGGAY